MVSFKTIIILVTGLFFITAPASAHEWMAPESAAKIKNPLNKQPQSIALGKSVYTEFCIHCHGGDAKGMDPEEIGLNKRPTNLRKTLKSHSDGDIFWKINTGRKEMPSFKDDLEEKEVWSVIHFIRSLENKNI